MTVEMAFHFNSLPGGTKRGQIADDRDDKDNMAFEHEFLLLSFT